MRAMGDEEALITRTMQWYNTTPSTVKKIAVWWRARLYTIMTIYILSYANTSILFRAVDYRYWAFSGSRKSWDTTDIDGHGDSLRISSSLKILGAVKVACSGWNPPQLHSTWYKLSFTVTELSLHRLKITFKTARQMQLEDARALYCHIYVYLSSYESELWRQSHRTPPPMKKLKQWRLPAEAESRLLYRFANCLMWWAPTVTNRAQAQKIRSFY